MRWGRFVLGVVVCSFGWASSASGILIKTGGVRVGGDLVRENDTTLTIRLLTSDGPGKETDYARAKVEIVHQLDVKRLEALSKADPKAYADYADELARQEDDPEAKYTARRLYLIAASLDPKNLGTRSLLRLSALAGTPAEARKCRALAYMLGGKADAKLLARDEVEPVRPPEIPADGLRDFTRSLQSYRAGKVQLAGELANRKGMDKIFGLAPGGLDQKSFRRMCADANCATCKSKGKVRCSTCAGKGFVRGPFGGNDTCTACGGKKMVTCDACAGRGISQDISDDTLRVLLRAELWAAERLSGDAPGGKRKKGGDEKWSALLEARRLNPVTAPTLETVTEIDPRKYHYRNRKWVVPSD